MNYILQTLSHIKSASSLAVLFLAASIMPFGGAVAWAEEAYIVDVVREGGGDTLAVSATLKGGFTSDIRQAVDSGAPVTFTYLVQLKKKRPLVWDETLRELAIKRMVVFDSLSKKYLAWEKKGEDEDDIEFRRELEKNEYNRSGATGAQAGAPAKATGEDAPAPVMEPLVLQNSAELERWMTRLEKVGMGSSGDLKKSARHYYRVRCKMKSIKLMAPFNYILFFMSLFDFDTEWANSTMFTLNGGAAAPVSPGEAKGK